MKGRTAAWAEIGLSHRLWFTETDPYDTPALPFELCERGDGVSVRNVLCGRWRDMEVRAFDLNVWERQEGRLGRHSPTEMLAELMEPDDLLASPLGATLVTERWECAVMRVGAACARSSIAPRGVLSGIADVLSIRDLSDRLVEFEWDDFNRSFEVRSTDRRFVNDFLDARMLSLLYEQAQGSAIELVGNRVLVARAQADPPEPMSLLELGAAIEATVPRVVHTLYPAMPGTPLTPGCPVTPDGTVQMPEAEPTTPDDLDPGGWAPRRPR